MAFLKFPNLAIRGLSASVPHRIEENEIIYAHKWGNGYTDFVKTTGVERAHRGDGSLCTSDLCCVAAEKLILNLNWDKQDVEALIFVTQTPDYKLPATSCILQERLGLSNNCYTLDISLGCSGWVYGLSTIAGLMSNGGIKKGLLLAGDTLTSIQSSNNKSTWPLFGDAGTATAIEYQKGAIGFMFNMNTDGSGADAIIVPDGGCRRPYSELSRIPKELGDGLIASDADLHLDGVSVFSFGLTKAPKSVKKLCEYFDINFDTIDLCTFHQANMYMNEKIRLKLGLPAEKVPYSLRDFGNTSCASIPLTLITQRKEYLQHNKLKHIACGFGVGLSWGSVYFETENIIVSSLIEL